MYNSVLEAPFVKGYVKMANEGYERGWHERNGGNLSYRIKKEEIESVKALLEFQKNLHLLVQLLKILRMNTF